VGFFRVFLGSSRGAGVCVPLINTAERRRGVPVKAGWALVPWDELLSRQPSSPGATGSSHFARTVHPRVLPRSTLTLVLVLKREVISLRTPNGTAGEPVAQLGKIRVWFVHRIDAVLAALGRFQGVLTSLTIQKK